MYLMLSISAISAKSLRYCFLLYGFSWRLYFVLGIAMESDVPLLDMSKYMSPYMYSINYKFSNYGLYYAVVHA